MAFARLIKPNEKVHLKDFDPSDHGDLEHNEAQAALAKLGEKLAALEDLLFEAGKQSLLLVFQGPDAAGKDGSIRSILQYVNVQSTSVVPFKVPSAVEMAHDFLWRIHRETPGNGSIAIFNRSHYEDVLVARVHKLVPKDVWKKRFDRINEFEELLTDSGTIVLKFFLHISKQEQEERLLDREKNVEKSWKLNVNDWKERDNWSGYIEAYEDVLEKCSTKHAPWFVVPANHKWFRDVAIFEAIVDALEPYKKDWLESLEERGRVQKAELTAYRKSQKL